MLIGLETLPAFPRAPRSPDLECGVCTLDKTTPSFPGSLCPMPEAGSLRTAQPGARATHGPTSPDVHHGRCGPTLSVTVSMADSGGDLAQGLSPVVSAVGLPPHHLPSGQSRRADVGLLLLTQPQTGCGSQHFPTSALPACRARTRGGVAYRGLPRSLPPSSVRAGSSLRGPGGLCHPAAAAGAGFHCLLEVSASERCGQGKEAAAIPAHSGVRGQSL